MKETIQFSIPNSMLEVLLEKYKNSNWKFTLINKLNDSRKLIKKSISDKVMTKIINNLTQGKYNKFLENTLEEAYQEFTKKVDQLSKTNNINNI